MRLLFITGKGGVGKSAITAALATGLAGRGRRVAVVELGDRRISSLFEAAAADGTGIKISKNITLFRLEAGACFEEYAGLHLPRAAFLVQNRLVHHFVDACPGLNEILLLGKIAALSREKKWDFLLVDSPATGHTISLCEAPRTAMRVLKEGNLKTMIRDILDIFKSPRTRFLLITQLENFIVEETGELYEHLTRKLSLACGGVLVNGATDFPFSPSFDSTTSTLLHLNTETPPPLLAILKAAREKQKRQEKFLQRLQKKIPEKFGTVFWEDSQTDENKLRKELAVQLQPWLSQNFFNEKD